MNAPSLVKFGATPVAVTTSFKEGSLYGSGLDACKERVAGL